MAKKQKAKPETDAGPETAPDEGIAADLPQHARERLAEMRQKGLFTSDLSVNEFLLVKQAGFEPLGLVLGTSIYRIKPSKPSGDKLAEELEEVTRALYHARELAMTRMEEEAEALGADGIVGVRLEVNLHAWGRQIAEFIAIGTAVRHEGGGGRFRNKAGKPFTSDLSGQDFWTLLHAGWRPVGMVMGNCVYYVSPYAANGYIGQFHNQELPVFSKALYEAREEAMERLEEEAEALDADGVVGVSIKNQQHAWRGFFGRFFQGNLQNFNGEVIEFFVVGTAVVKREDDHPLPEPKLMMRIDDLKPIAGSGGGE